MEKRLNKTEDAILYETDRVLSERSSLGYDDWTAYLPTWKVDYRSGYILGFAVSQNLKLFVEQRLQKNPQLLQGASGFYPLLDYALWPIQIGAAPELFDDGMVIWLLDNGACPNTVYRGGSTWCRFLTWLRRTSHQSTHDVVPPPGLPRWCSIHREGLAQMAGSRTSVSELTLPQMAAVETLIKQGADCSTQKFNLKTIDPFAHSLGYALKHNSKLRRSFVRENARKHKGEYGKKW